METPIKMKFIKAAILLFLFIGLVIFLPSCDEQSNNNKQKEANIYYNRLTEITSDVEKNQTNFSDYFKIIAPLAKKNPDYRINNNKIDSLSIYYSTMTSSFNRSIHKLKDIGEFDTTLKTVKFLLNSYQAIKNSYDSTIPVYLEVYKKGWIASSISQRETIMQASNILNRAYLTTKENTDSFGIQLMNFIKKYKIKY